MKIRDHFAFGLSILALLLLIYLVVDRCLFLRDAQQTTGEVVELTAQNSRCGSRFKHDCTVFRARVRYLVQDRAFGIWVGASSASGHNHTPREARYAIGSPVPLVFNARRPQEVYEDGDVWWAPALTLFFQLVTLVKSFIEPRR